MKIIYFILAFRPPCRLLSHDTYRVKGSRMLTSMSCFEFIQFGFCFYRFFTTKTTACVGRLHSLFLPHTVDCDFHLFNWFVWGGKKHFRFRLARFVLLHGSTLTESWKNQSHITARQLLTLSANFFTHTQQLKVDFLWIWEKIGKISISINFVIELWSTFNNRRDFD